MVNLYINSIIYSMQIFEGGVGGWVVTLLLVYLVSCTDLFIRINWFTVKLCTHNIQLIVSAGFCVSLIVYTSSGATLIRTCELQTPLQ